MIRNIPGGTSRRPTAQRPQRPRCGRCCPFFVAAERRAQWAAGQQFGAAVRYTFQAGRRLQLTLRDARSRNPGDRYFKVAPKHLLRRQKDHRAILHETVMKNVQKTCFGTFCPEFPETGFSKWPQNIFRDVRRIAATPYTKL